jgi:hypothetical protein
VSLPASLADTTLSRLLSVVPGLELDQDRDLTSPMSPAPVGRHFTLDSVASGDNYAFHLDLIPRVEPIDRLRTPRLITWRGSGVDREFSVEARRDADNLFFEGPEAYGKAIGFGRASFSALHLTDLWKIKGPEFSIDASPGMSAGKRLSVVYQLFDSARLDSVLHGLLEWVP